MGLIYLPKGRANEGTGQDLVSLGKIARVGACKGIGSERILRGPSRQICGLSKQITEEYQKCGP